MVVEPGDLAGIEAALRSLARGTLERADEPRALEPFIYPGPARSALELVDEAIAARG